MINIKKTYFISDLHLEEERQEIADIFMQFLSQQWMGMDALYILGDLFETWIGDDDRSPFHLNIMQALKTTVANGVPIFLVHGNRDFLIGKKFLAFTGCKLLPDISKIILYGTPVLIMHGDTLCTRDTAYLAARKKARNVIYQKLFLLLPLRIRKKIAQRMRNQSAKHTGSTSHELMDVTDNEVMKELSSHQTQYLIHGHTHRQAIHELSDGKKRIVLGDWHKCGNALSWSPDGSYTFLTLS